MKTTMTCAFGAVLAAATAVANTTGFWHVERIDGRGLDKPKTV